MTDERIVPRLPGLPAEGLDPQRAALDAKLREGVGRYLQGFVSERADGALIGPFPAMLRFPEYGAPAWDLFLALAEHTVLPAVVHEVVILRVGAATTAMYELYSHEVRARDAGLAQSKVRTIVAGQRPADLTDEEGIAFDVAAVLTAGRQVPDSTYDAAVQAFGQQGAAEIAYLVDDLASDEALRRSEALATLTDVVDAIKPPHTTQTMRWTFEQIAKDPYTVFLREVWVSPFSQADVPAIP